MVTRITLAAVFLAAFAPFASGADDSRDRKARAALALAGTAQTPSVVVASAPPPRVASKLPYGDGVKAATLEQTPLVVFVACDGPRPTGAISSKADSLGDVVAPAVVVAYPVADRLFIDAKIPAADATPARVQRAVDDAAKKLDVPPAKRMPAPKALDWQILAEPARGPCVCGAACDCEAKGRVCPGGCPVAAKKDGPPKGYPAVPGYEWVRDARGPDGWGLRQAGTAAAETPKVVAQPAAANPVTYRLPSAPSFPFGNGPCVGGNCPNRR